MLAPTGIKWFIQAVKFLICVTYKIILPTTNKRFGYRLSVPFLSKCEKTWWVLSLHFDFWKLDHQRNISGKSRPCGKSCKQATAIWQFSLLVFYPLIDTASCYTTGPQIMPPTLSILQSHQSLKPSESSIASWHLIIQMKRAMLVGTRHRCTAGWMRWLLYKDINPARGINPAPSAHTPSGTPALRVELNIELPLRQQHKGSTKTNKRMRNRHFTPSPAHRKADWIGL